MMSMNGRKNMMLRYSKTEGIIKNDKDFFTSRTIKFK